MANSPAHKFGQIIGDALEAALSPRFYEFALENSLYFDKKGRRGTRSGKKVTWVDANNNKHDLDFVLERGGSYSNQGDPAAFIEVAWRRYTRHSRNKAQEIQGAILPLAATFKSYTPFIGTILAGEFTNGAITQLTSLGFTVLHFSYDQVVSAFSVQGIDASSDDNTPDDVFTKKIEQWNALSNDQKNLVYLQLIELNKDEVNRFFKTLGLMVNRNISCIKLLPLHGLLHECITLEEAIDFLKHYNNFHTNEHAVKYEIEIRYSNGDNVKTEFTDKELAMHFLSSYLSLK